MMMMIIIVIIIIIMNDKLGQLDLLLFSDHSRERTGFIPTLMMALPLLFTPVLFLL